MSHYKVENPKNEELKFKPEKNKETINYYCHWIVYVPSILVITITTIISALIVLGSNTIENIIILDASIILTVAFTIFALGIAIASRNILYWQYRIYQLTNEQILAVELTPWFNYQIEEMDIVSIQYIESHAHGLVPKLISYKHIEIADEMGKDLDLRWVDKAHDLLKKVQENMDKLNQESE